MIDPDWVRLMARYGAWQNASLADAADGLGGDARRADRGAFFGSIEGTLNHLLWGDRMWLKRFGANAAPVQGSIPDSVRETANWADYRTQRAATDAAMQDWAGAVSAEALAGDLTWWSGAARREVSRPMALLVTHFFNHATHHRGQVHAMLTAAGAEPGDTDLFLMP